VTRRPSLAVVPAEREQLVRRDALEQAHPEVSTAYDHDHGFWRGVIREPAGETSTVRYSLRELLDRLGELLAGPGG
jgi:hypothetical protein